MDRSSEFSKTAKVKEMLGDVYFVYKISIGLARRLAL